MRRWLIAEDNDDAAYEQEVHPENRKFWKDLPKQPGQALGKHPVFTLEGEGLDKASYKHTRGLSKKHDVQMGNLGAFFQQMMQHEHAHKEALEKLAVRAVSKLMHVPEDELSAKLTSDVEVNETEPLEPEKMKAMTPRLLEEANKRITSNAFSQGASVNAYLTAHFLDEIEAAIKKIAPELMKIYSHVATGSHHLYWLMNMSEQMLGQAAVGSVRPKQEKDGTIKMEARAPIFIVLVQELVKGVLEKRYLDQLMESDLSDEDIKTIYQYADKIEDEPRLIQIGPELWRRFLKVVNTSSVKKKPIEVYQHLIRLSPKDLHEFVQLVVSKPQEASDKLELLLRDKTQDWKEGD
jgi:hypothetical protein